MNRYSRSEIWSNRQTDTHTQTNPTTVTLAAHARRGLIRDLLDMNNAVILDDCQVKRAKRGNDMEILLKRNTAICCSPKKFKIEKRQDVIISLEDIKKKDEFDRVSVQCKVVKVSDTTTGHVV